MGGLFLGLLLSSQAGCLSKFFGSSGKDKSAVKAIGFSSSVVQVSDDLVGTLVRPKQPGPHPTVLMLHGFGSKRDEVGDIYKRTAVGLSAEGIASLRIDFRGSGDSAGEFRTITIDRQIADAEAALAWLQKQDDVDSELLGLLGFSLGGAIAVLTTSRHSDEIKSLAVWAPTAELQADFLESLGRDTFDEARRTGSAKKDLGWREVTLDRKFFDSLEQWDVGGALLAFEGPFLAVAGAKDPLARHARALAQSVDRMAVIVRDADHIFFDAREQKSRADTAIQATVVHFTGTLKWKKEQEEDGD